MDTDISDFLSMRVSAHDAVWRTGLAPHGVALLHLLTDQHPAALPDELSEDVDLTELLGSTAPLLLPPMERLV